LLHASRTRRVADLFAARGPPWNRQCAAQPGGGRARQGDPWGGRHRRFLGRGRGRARAVCRAAGVDRSRRGRPRARRGAGGSQVAAQDRQGREAEGGKEKAGEEEVSALTASPPFPLPLTTLYSMTTTRLLLFP